MKIESTTTGIIIRQGTDDIKRRCLKFFSLQQPIREYFVYSGNNTKRKPVFGKDHDVIFITSGIKSINDPIIKKVLRSPQKITPQTPKHIDLEVSRTPRSQLQRDCIDTLCNSKSNKITVELKPGTGKEQPYSTKIPTPTKQMYKLMGDLQVGDFVFGRDGRPTKVIKIFEQGEKDVYKITFEDNRTAYCGIDHLWDIYIDNVNERTTLPLREMIDIIKYSKLSIPLCEPVKYILDNHHSKYDKLFDHILNNTEDKIDIKLSPNEEIIQLLYSLGLSVYIEDDCLYCHKAKQLNIVSIEYSHKEQCRCIMVDNDEHLYLTEDYIVTHNTFIALKSISQLGYKPLIVAPTTLLKNQWIENFENDGIPKDDIAKDIYDAPNKKICVVTISSIENELRKDWSGLMNVIKESQFGIKIIDEAHLHLKGMLRLDSICNIKHNWYLSATLGRSNPDEDRILNRAMLDAERFVGDEKYEEYQNQYVHIYLQDIYYHPSAKLCNKTFKYGTKGLIKPTYYNMLMTYENGMPFLSNISRMIKIAKKISKDDSKKIVVLVPMIKIIDSVMSYIKKDPYYKKYNIVSIDGSMSLSDRLEKLKTGDIILSTSMSLGTGIDISDLIAVINFDQYASSIITEQICGRLRDRGWDCYYFDICDKVKYAKTIANWGNKRRIVLPYFPGVYKKMKMLPDIRC